MVPRYPQKNTMPYCDNWSIGECAVFGVPQACGKHKNINRYKKIKLEIIIWFQISDFMCKKPPKRTTSVFFVFKSPAWVVVSFSATNIEGGTGVQIHGPKALGILGWEFQPRHLPWAFRWKTQSKTITSIRSFFPIITLFVVVVRLLCVAYSEHIVVGKWYIVSTCRFSAKFEMVEMQNRRFCDWAEPILQGHLEMMTFFQSLAVWSFDNKDLNDLTFALAPWNFSRNWSTRKIMSHLFIRAHDCLPRTKLPSKNPQKSSKGKPTKLDLKIPNDSLVVSGVWASCPNSIVFQYFL